MLQVKIILFFLIVSVAGGGYVYVQKLQKDNAILKINTVKLETAVTQNEEVIKNQVKEFEQVRTTLSTVQKQKDALQGDKENLSKKLQRHDLGQLAYNKPGLVVKIINKASNNANRCIAIATGSPLTEDEIAATKKSQINGECPSLANPNYVQ